METPCIILAGGEGTRLRSVVSDRPKAMAPIGGIPFLQYLFENLYSQGVRQIVLSLSYRAEQIEAFVEQWQNRPRDLVIRSVREPHPLGTGGALQYVVQALGIRSPIYVVNGDTYLPTGFGEFHASMQSDLSLNGLGLVQVDDTSRFGRVEFSEDQYILNFHEKTEGAGSGWINSGLYYLQPDVLLQNQERFSLEIQVLPQLIRAKKLRGICLATDFIDIGIPSDYHRFERFLEQNNKC